MTGALVQINAKALAANKIGLTSTQPLNSSSFINPSSNDKHAEAQSSTSKSSLDKEFPE